jgi:hypothetical protein
MTNKIGSLKQHAWSHSSVHKKSKDILVQPKPFSQAEVKVSDRIVLHVVDGGVGSTFTFTQVVDQIQFLMM